MNEKKPVNFGRQDSEPEREESQIADVPFYSKRKVMVPLLISLAALVVAGILLVLNSRNYVSTDDAFIDGNKVTIGSKYSGRIAKLNVDERDAVKKGQVLVQLDDSDLRAQKQQSEAAWVYAEQNLKLANINLDRADEDFKRAEVQFKDNIISKEQFDHAQKALEAARAQSSIAEAQIATAKAQVGVVDTQLQNISIVSPMDGVVAKRWALAGDVVQTAQPILSVYDLKNLWVTANMEETKYALLKLNDTVAIYVDAYGGKKFEGKVIGLGSNTASEFSLIPPNNASGNFTKVAQRIPIKISINEIGSNSISEKYPLLPGMSVEVTLKVK